jgi:uncharacterized damage-inducible protein DinB
MTLRELAVAFAAYNRWMNEKIYACAAQLTDEQRKRDLGAFFGSLHGTLNHLLLGDRNWMQRFHGQPVTATSLREELHRDFESLWTARRQMDDAIDAWAATLTETFADTPFRFRGVGAPQDHTVPGWAAAMHLFNHQTHHRGQATTLLKQLGQDPGVTDLPWMPHFNPPSR